MENKTGCLNCKYLGYYEAYPEESSDSGYTCEFKDVGHFKTFPCKRKLKCFKEVKA